MCVYVCVHACVRVCACVLEYVCAQVPILVEARGQFWVVFLMPPTLFF